MWQTVRHVFFGAAVISLGVLAARAIADDDKHEIKGGIEGKVKSVNTETKALTITTTQGRDRTFTITEDTTMLGPRGGKVRRGLKDPRFHEGLSVTIVAEGNAATEVHLGYDRHSGATRTDTKTSKRDAERTDTERADKATRKTPPATGERVSARDKKTKPVIEDDEDNEVPGRVKRFDPERRVLVVTMLNGKDRSFLLPREVKVVVKGAASKHGMEDPALKVGAYLEVVTDEGGHKVKELKIVPASEIKRKAG